ncbi:MAG TPA: aldo/keto reductase [Gaiellaceae bacterium]|nr:aldo/keto reductase [Gaiellaceae bacterium]
MNDVERIVLGGAELRDDSTHSLLDLFVARGGRALDLGNVYADGESEQVVGRWLARGERGVTLYVKGCHPPRCAPELVAEEVEIARTRLGVETLDVFVLHRDDTEVPAAAWAERLLADVERGRIRAFGVSNWSVERFRELQAALGGDGAPLAVFSNHFSLGTMVAAPWPGCLAMTRDEAAALASEGTLVLAWASLAAGYFARRGIPEWESPENEARRRRAEELAAERGTSATAVALAYVLAQPPHVLPVVGTRSAERLEELFGAASLELSAAEVVWLETG